MKHPTVYIDSTQSIDGGLGDGDGVGVGRGRLRMEGRGFGCIILGGALPRWGPGLGAGLRRLGVGLPATARGSYTTLSTVSGEKVHGILTFAVCFCLA